MSNDGLNTVLNSRSLPWLLTLLSFDYLSLHLQLWWRLKSSLSNEFAHKTKIVEPQPEQHLPTRDSIETTIVKPQAQQNSSSPTRDSIESILEFTEMNSEHFFPRRQEHRKDQTNVHFSIRREPLLLGIN